MSSPSTITKVIATIFHKLLVDTQSYYSFAVAVFAFEETVYAFSEGDGDGNQLFVEITNSQIQLPERNRGVIVSIEVVAVIDVSSNATKGIISVVGVLC